MNSASTVLRGAGGTTQYGRNSVAPPGNQAANRENKPRPGAWKPPAYSTRGLKIDDRRQKNPVLNEVLFKSWNPAHEIAVDPVAVTELIRQIDIDSLKCE